MALLEPIADPSPWREVVKPYVRPTLRQSWWQVANTVIPFLLSWYAMYLALTSGWWWLTLLLAPLAVGLRVRLFIIFHDCTHGAFFKSKRANDILGTFCGVICLTPYHHWRHNHLLHHASSGILERRLPGEVVPMTLKKYVQKSGDILTLTVREYLQLSPFQKLVYRAYRHPVMLFIVLPALLFVVIQRFPSANGGKRERYGIYGTDLALLALIVGLGLLLGFTSFFLVELLVVIGTTTIGGWLFYIQHHFEHAYWQPKGEWDFAEAALQGSSYYKLPWILQWFSGNIGFHHIHHLSPRIPNYQLSRCHRDNPLFQEVRGITFWSGMRSIFSNLWDEEAQKMIAFGHLVPSKLPK